KDQYGAMLWDATAGVWVSRGKPTGRRVADLLARQGKIDAEIQADDARAAVRHRRRVVGPTTVAEAMRRQRQVEIEILAAQYADDIPKRIGGYLTVGWCLKRAAELNRDV